MATVEDVILSRFSRQFHKCFNVQCPIGTSVDDVRNAAKLQNGKPLELPYAFMKIQRYADPPASSAYNNHYLMRRGLIVWKGTDDQTYQTVRMMRVNTEVEITYLTNKMQGDTDSVMFFARRWMFARRGGYLKFQTKLGGRQFRVGVMMDEQVSTPARENIGESSSEFRITANLTIEGWIAEPYVGEKGNIQEIEVVTATSPGANVRTESWKYPPKPATTT